jgi:hypothetical protein
VNVTKSNVLCRHCKLFVPLNLGFDSSLVDYGKCKKFVRHNVINREPEYEFALSSRRDFYKCGKDGIYFKNKSNEEFIFPKFATVNIKT